MCNPLKVEENWAYDYNFENEDYEITLVDKDFVTIVPTPLDMGAVHQRLIKDTMMSKGNYMDGIRGYNDDISNPIGNYNCSTFYEPSYVITRAFQNSGF